ncbi:unnamed protein product [Boreogadus saida]
MQDVALDTLPQSTTGRSTDTISSSYRRGKQQDVRARGGARAEQSKVKAEGTCIYCGEAGHGKTPQWRARRAECPAYGKTCRKCNRQNHLDKACLGGRSSRPAPEETDGVCDEQQATAFGELCTLTSTADMNRAADAMSRRPVGTPCPSPMDLSDDNAAMVTHLSPSAHADVLSLIRWAGPVGDDVEEGDLAWCAAGLESLQSVTWDRVREAISSSDDMRTLEEMAADCFPESRAEMPVAIRGFHQYREDITSADGFYPVHSDRPPPRSIYDDLASRVAVPALSTRLPGLVSGPVRPVTESGPAPPPALPPAGSPRRGMQPTPIVPVVPAQGVLRTPPPGFVAPMVTLPPPPDVPPATDLRRSTRRAGVPAWHKDFAMG